MTSPAYYADDIVIWRNTHGRWFVFCPLSSAERDNIDEEFDTFDEAVEFTRTLILPPPERDTIIVWDADPGMRGVSGWYDAWNGWYATETEALTDAVGWNCTPEFVKRTRTLHFGEQLMSMDELERLGRVR